MPSLDFKGKQFVYAHHLSVPFRQLDIDKKKSLPKDGKPSLDDNLIIHGDNLHALKALLPKYAGKVKCIYIDPPYNTGNEGWCYNDNVNAPLIKEWLKDSANPVDKEDLERHDKWLCMMWPRLQLLRELLAEDGTIWISIDDDEQGRLRLICDEIFGADNFISNAIWEKKFSPQNDAKWLSDNHDFIIAFAKDKNIWRPNKLPRTDDNNSRFKNLDDDPRGAWASSDMTVKTYSAANDYPITTPSGKVINPTKGRCWSVSKDKFAELIKENRVWFGKSGDNVPRFKSFLSDMNEGIVPLTIWKHGDVGHNQGARQELKAIFSDKDHVFDTPKPVSLIQRILQIATNENDIILDSFAGSGTTAHAVLALNKEDGGNRKFILVECEDYANDITAERVRRVIGGVPDAKDDALKEGLGGSFTFCDLGQEINIENLLKGEKLPEYEELARYAFYTATGLTLDDVKQGADYFIGETENYRVHLIYKPDLAFLRSGESALNMPLAKSISAARDNTGKSALVFATHKFMGQKELTDMGITYCQLPYAIHRVMGD